MAFLQFKPVQHRVADSGFLGELSIRQFSPLFSQEFGKLTIKAFSHLWILEKKPLPMGDDVLDMEFGRGAELRAMKTSWSHFFVWNIWVMVWAFALLDASAQTNSFTPIVFKLPILTVSQNETGKWSGQLIHLDLTITKTTADRPLLVAIAEDRPNGVGEQFRAALWSAASTVALERGNPMRGYHIELTAEDAVDGPSAGAMITLAIMTALDGRNLTNDFAFTGSILPNGSVGYVGGVVQKIEAAKAAGKTRVFVPAYYRAEKDQNTGETVDLKEKCRSLGLRMIPVGNIRQAYALMNNIEEGPFPSASLKMPDEVEDLYVGLYRRELANGTSVFDKLTLEQKQTITNTPLLKKFILGRAQKADQSYRAGNLPSAYDNISDLTASIEGYADADRFISGLKINDLNTKEVINLFDKEIAVATDDRVNALSKYLSSGIATNDPAQAQYDNFANEISTFGALGDYLNNQVKSFMSQADQTQDTNQINNLYTQARVAKFYQLWFTDAWKHSSTQADYKEFSKLFKDKAATAAPTHRGIEQLLFNSMEAAFNAYIATTIKPYADQNDTSADNVTRYLCSTDISFLDAQSSRLASEQMRRTLKEDNTLYMLTSQVRNHAHALAQITGQTLKDELEADTDDAGNVHYGNVTLLQGLLQSAREEALAAIARCENTGVQCWEPIAAVHIADAKRDEIDEDKMDVFEEYFDAALDAKILTLMCGKN